jgi:uncharacterized membrane protein YgcG
MRNATSIGLFGASALALIILGACGGGSGDGRSDGTSGSTNTGGTTVLPTGGSSTTAGTTSAGTSPAAGSSAGGSGAGGGAPTCDPKPGSKAGDGMNTTIDELDDTNTMFSPAGTGMGSWDFGKDTAATAMGTIMPTGTMTLMPVTGGHMGSALHVTGTGLTGWGASLAAFLNGATGSFDASSYGGVAFWIKGTTTVQEGMNKLMVQARMPDVLPGPGSCCSDTVVGSECYSGHRTTIDVPADWTEVKIPWTAFVGPAWGLGSTLAFNPNRVRDINFSFNHDTMTMGAPATSFDVWIDGIRFMKKDEMGNVGGGTGGSGNGGSGGSGAGTGGGGSSSGGGGAGGSGGTQ